MIVYHALHKILPNNIFIQIMKKKKSSINGFNHKGHKNKIKLAQQDSTCVHTTWHFYKTGTMLLKNSTEMHLRVTLDRCSEHSTFKEINIVV